MKIKIILKVNGSKIIEKQSKNAEFIVERTKICPNWLGNRKNENEYLKFLLNGFYLVSIKSSLKIVNF